MNRKQVHLEAQVRNYQQIPNGVQWEAVIFSSEFNRNRAYFDIKKAFQPFANQKDLLNKVLLNNNHDGKYFSIVQDKVTDLIIKESEDGQITEVYAVVVSTNQDKRKNPESVTGFSIELFVEPEDVATFSDGAEFYRKVEWGGLAYLTGVLAGSGNTRLLAMRTFAQAVEEENQSNSNMNEDQLKALLNEQEAKLTAAFAEKTEQLKKEFGEIVGQSNSQNDSVYEWTDENGNQFKRTSKQIYESITELINTGTMGDNLLQMAESKGYKVYKETDEDRELADITMTFKKLDQEKREKIKTTFKAISNEELVSNRGQDPDVEKSASNETPGWYQKIVKNN